MRTTINSQPAEWPDDVRAWFDREMAARPPATVVTANYFTPRPYVDQYNTGSNTEGFVYVIGRSVCIITRIGRLKK